MKMANCGMAVLASVLLATSLAACGKDGGAAAPVVGKWKIVEAEGPGAEMNKGTVYEFRTDGTLLVTGMGLRNTFTYSVAGDTVTWVMNKNFTFSAKFKINGRRMTYAFVTSSQKFVMERQ